MESLRTRQATIRLRKSFSIPHILTMLGGIATTRHKGDECLSRVDQDDRSQEFYKLDNRGVHSSEIGLKFVRGCAHFLFTLGWNFEILLWQPHLKTEILVTLLCYYVTPTSTLANSLHIYIMFVSTPFPSFLLLHTSEQTIRSYLSQCPLKLSEGTLIAPSR